MCRFKFRLWNCRRSAKISRTAWLNKAIINIKRSRWKAVTAFIYYYHTPLLPA